MAVTTQNGDQYELQYGSTLGAVYGTEVRGKVCKEYFSHTQSGAGDAGSSVAICKLPPGRIRLLLPECWFYCNWTTASATLDLGNDAYTQIDGTAVAANVDSIIDGLSVDTVSMFGFEELVAAIGVLPTAVLGYTALFDSQDGIVIRASSTDTAIADADDLAGVLTYMVA